MVGSTWNHLQNSVINIRAVESCSISVGASGKNSSFKISLCHRTISILCKDSEAQNSLFIDAVSICVCIDSQLKYCLSFKLSEDASQVDSSSIDFLFCYNVYLICRAQYYLTLNGIVVTDLGLEEKDFTMEKKQKFIQNCSNKFSEGKGIIQQIFMTLGVSFLNESHNQKNPADSKINTYPQLVIDYPIASTIFVQVDGIGFLCNVSICEWL